MKFMFSPLLGTAVSGDVSSTLMRRVPDPDSKRWEHMSLFLSTKDERGCVWMEDFKFLAAYKLKPTVSGGLREGEREVYESQLPHRMYWSSNPSSGRWSSSCECILTTTLLTWTDLTAPQSSWWLSRLSSLKLSDSSAPLRECLSLSYVLTSDLSSSSSA